MKKIAMIRGTTLEFSIKVYNYTPNSGDVFKFGVKKSIEDKEFVIYKEQKNETLSDTFIIKITPSDTINANLGEYKYELALQTVDDNYYILIPPTQFTIKGSITQYEPIIS